MFFSGIKFEYPSSLKSPLPNVSATEFGLISSPNLTLSIGIIWNVVGICLSAVYCPKFSTLPNVVNALPFVE